MNKLVKKIILLLLSFLILSTVAKTFVNTTTARNTLPLFLFIGCSIVLLSFKQWLPVRWLIMVFLLFYSLYLYFPMDLSFPIPWASTFFNKAGGAFSILVDKKALAFTNELAFLLMHGMILILAYLLVVRKQWKPVLMISLVYYAALIAINRSNITTELFLLLIYSILFAFVYLVEFDFSKKTIRQVTIVLCLLVLAMSSWYFPSLFAQQHYELINSTISIRNKLSSDGFYSALEASKSTGISGVSGYSEIDSVLGGPSYRNDIPVFEAVQTTAHLWRIEAKEVYTGRGWQSDIPSGPLIDLREETISDLNQDYQTTTQAITFTSSTDNISYIPVPYGRISFDIQGKPVMLSRVRYNETSGRFSTLESEKDDLRSLTITYAKPSYTDEVLKGIVAPESSFELLPYLTIPQDTPQRVRTLAADLVKDTNNYYEQVRAIESYLKTSGRYRYSLNDAVVTPKEFDYSDYFLFESQVGYCEHFSTAMVVMLRSLGIPSRWAKGYAPGKITSRNEDGTARYLITNSDAHTWPEVYFPEVGWVPFEPTPSFSSQIQTSQNTTNPNNPSNPSTPTDPSNPSNPNNPSNPENPNQPETPNGQKKNNPSQFFTIMSPVALILSGTTLTAYIFYRWQKKRIQLMLWQHRLLKQKRFFTQEYQQMLIVLKNQVDHPKHQSIKTYINSIIKQFPEMSESLDDLTQTYHNIMFGTLQDYICTDDDQNNFLSVVDTIKKKERHKNR